MQEVEAVEIRSIGSAIKRTAIGRGEKHAVEAGVGDRRAEPAEGRVRDAVRGITRLANVARKTGLIGPVPGGGTQSTTSHTSAFDPPMRGG